MAATANYNTANGAISVNQSSGYSQSFSAVSGSASAGRSGATQRDSSMVQMLNADNTPCLNGAPSFLKLANKDGSEQKFSVASGKVVEMKTAKGAVMDKGSYDSQVKVEKDAFGQISRLESTCDGVMEFDRTSTKLMVSHYSREQMAFQQTRSARMELIPAKTYSYEWNDSAKTMNIVTQEAGKEPVYIERKVEETTNGNKVTIIKGLGDDRIVTIYERNYLTGNKWEEIKTLRGINDATPVSCVRTVKQSTPGGWLTLSETTGYSTALAQTTTYTYNNQYRVSLELKPNGGYTQYEYDDMGRVVMETSPWADGEFLKVIHTTYADLRFNDYRPAQVCVTLKNASGTETEVKRTEYSYEDSPQANRMTTTATALGVAGSRVTIEETYGEAAANAYSRGRVKMKQDQQGIQQVFTYENTVIYGATWKVTMETRINGVIVHGQSRKKVEYLAFDETIVREEEYVHTGNEWSLISSSNYEYDDQKRRTKTTRGNGRISTAKWGCCGPLEEVNEDGVKLSYGYNTSRQLVEITRSATETTPETITSQVRNAEGNILTEHKHIGPMATIMKSSYDILGRVVSTIDELGRETKTEYADQGLIETTILPSGATLIKRFYTDGTLEREYGSGQRNIIQTVNVSSDGLTLTRHAISEGTIIVLSQTIANGFGEIICQSQANTDGGFIHNRTTYNNLGQMSRFQRNGMSPVLYEYNDFGDLSKEIIPLNKNPSPLNSRITEKSWSFEMINGKIYRSDITMKYNCQGNPLIAKRSVLISELDVDIESDIIETDSKGNVTKTWTEYSIQQKRIRNTQIPESNVLAKEWVVDGILTKKIDAAGLETLYTRSYQSNGMTDTITDSRGNTETVIKDIQQRGIRRIDAAHHETKTHYDFSTGKKSCIINALGKTKYMSYDERGRKISEYGTAVQPFCLEYDEADHVVSLTTFRVKEEAITSDPKNRTDGDKTIWSYDAATGLVLGKTYASGVKEIYKYDAWNRLVEVQDGSMIPGTNENVKKSLVYDELTGESIGIFFNDGTPSIRYEYNHLGLKILAIDAAGTRTFTYDEWNELVSETTSGLVSSVLTYTKDTYGRNSGYMLNYAGNIVHRNSLSYDDRSRLTRIQMNSPENSFTYRYNELNGLLDGISYPNNMHSHFIRENSRNLIEKIQYGNTLTDNDLGEIEYAYDALMRPSSQKDSFEDSTPDFIHEYSYNDRNEIREELLSNNSAFSYSYDNVGNRNQAIKGNISTIYESNNLNQYSSISQDNETFTPNYDVKGNQTLVKSSTGQWMVTYNALNQAVKFEQGTKRVTCLYDDMNRRVEKTCYEGDLLVCRKLFIYKGYLQIAELDAENEASPVLRKTYLWNPDEQIATYLLAVNIFDEVGTFVENLFYAQDSFKNTVALYGESKGLRASYKYDSYGNIIKSDGDCSMINPFRFSCEYTDDELGLVYYNYRYYEPVEGRWISRDLIAESIYNNLYYFSGSVFLFDYLGLASLDGYPKPFRDWVHRQKKPNYIKDCPGKNGQKNPDVPQEKIREWYEEWKEKGKPDGREKKEGSGTREKGKEKQSGNENGPEPGEPGYPEPTEDENSSSSTSSDFWDKTLKVGAFVGSVAILVAAVACVADGPVGDYAAAGLVATAWANL